MADDDEMPSQLMVDDGAGISQSVASLVATDDHQSTDKSKRVVLQPANCVVILNGQKCQLKINPDSGVLMAYPIKDEPVTTADDVMDSSDDQQVMQPPPGKLLSEPTEVLDERGEAVMAAEDGSSNISIFQSGVVTELHQNAMEDFVGQSATGGESATEIEDVSNNLVVDTSDGVQFIPPSDETLDLPEQEEGKESGNKEKLPELIIPSVGGQVTSMAINQEQVMGVTNVGPSIIASASKSSKEGVIEDVFCPELTITSNMKPLLKQFLINPGTSSGKGSSIGIKTSGQDLKKLHCTDCDFQAYYPHQYDTHLKEHHSSQLHKCRCCGYVTLVETELTNHYMDLHPRNICQLCNFVSEHGYVIKRHMYRHSAEGCTCDICGKTYKDQYILKMHVKMVHSPAEVLYQCEFCSKRFTRKAHLKRHARTHSTNKAFGCPHCEYRGCERSDVTKHMLIHEAPKLVCEVCGKTFRHQKNKDLHMKRHNGQRDFKCGVCDFFGYTFTDIRKHIERRHTEWKNNMCEKCGARLKSHAALLEHMKNWHENPQGSIASTSSGPDAIIFVDGGGGQTSQTDENTLIINPDGTILSSEQEEQVIAEGEESVVEYTSISVVDLEQENVTIADVSESIHDQSVSGTTECVTEIVDLPMSM